MRAETANGGEDAPHPAHSLNWAGSDWLSQDIGMLLIGGATPDGDAITLHAGGSDIWGSADQFHYLYQRVSGDFTAIVQITQSPTTNGWSKTGIMVRQSIDPSAPHLLVCGTDAHGIRIQYRAKAKSSSADIAGPAWRNGAPVWLKLERKGQSVTGYSSPDRETWTKVGTVQIDLQDPVLIGLASTSHSYAVLGDAKFNSFTLEQG